MNVEAALWRALAAFRIVACVYASVLIVSNHQSYLRPAGGWAVLAVMALWTAFTVRSYARRRPGPALAGLDLVVSVSCLLATGLVESQEHLAEGSPNLTASWVATPVMVWALRGGIRWGVAAAVLVGVPDTLLRWLYGGEFQQTTVNGLVLLLMAGVVIGYLGRLALYSQERLARAVELEAATRERERLARDLHDSVLQVLALVRRRGNELGGEAAELGRLAGEQEVALRSLISRPAGEPEPAGEHDLRPLLDRYASSSVQISAPATPVRLPGRAAAELAAAVGAALDNVSRHCGPETRAWVLLEDDGERVTVSVRDDGPGIPEGRLEAAERDGRLGFSQSVRGRVRDLGGTVEIFSTPGAGTELELVVPRPG
ncbi:MacS family sensor histidine kinase [Actinocorallia aurantiaca]|uniref:DUF5931 domain-containing protein n=1 Tax=Actinocorallia aurantiaca TaxID=46204 RepID=A0ABP6GWQ0_9ACTN